jgi:cytochrome bd-type quinol oxidase subunit 2
MPKLRKFLSRCFGYASLISAVMFISLAPVVFRAPLPHATPPLHLDAVGLLLIAMRELLLLVPPVVAIVSGIAWFALRKGAQSARQWAIAASILSVIISAPFLAAEVAIMRYHLGGIVDIVGVLVLFAFLFLFGIAGLVTFSKRNSDDVTDFSLTTDTADNSGFNAIATTN